MAAEIHPDHGDLVERFYVPLLDCAVRYDRLTGYFSASALALAARGVEGLVLNGGRMRMVVGCTLDPPEIAGHREGRGAEGAGGPPPPGDAARRRSIKP